MQLNTKMIGAGFAAAIAAGVGYALLTRHEDEPDFATVERDGAVSIRDYPELLVAETVQSGPRDAALSCGVLALSDYLAGGKRHAMAAPVLADGDDDGRGWRTRLVMRGGVDPESLPEPGEGVTVRSLRARRVAALRFAGAADEVLLAEQEAELRDWIEEHGYSAVGPVEHAFYSAPLTPASLRRNEVLIPIAA